VCLKAGTGQEKPEGRRYAARLSVIAPWLAPAHLPVKGTQNILGGQNPHPPNIFCSSALDREPPGRRYGAITAAAGATASP